MLEQLIQGKRLVQERKPLLPKNMLLPPDLVKHGRADEDRDGRCGGRALQSAEEDLTILSGSHFPIQNEQVRLKPLNFSQVVKDVIRCTDSVAPFRTLLTKERLDWEKKRKRQHTKQ
jgi:hypothetical protein